MQVISSLVNLSTDKVSDLATQELVDELRRRIDVMSIVHEQFYAATDVSRIDFALYLTQVVSNLMEEYRLTPGVVEVRQNTIPLLLDLDAAIPAGLIVSELVSNALKALMRHNQKRGILAISIDHDAKDTATIIIEDNGPGLPSGFDPKAEPTLGFRLIEILAQQLHGSISFISVSGTKAILRFPHTA